MVSDTDVGTHLYTTKLDVHELVRQLVSHLGPTLVATLANVRDPKLPHKWARADGPEPRPESYQRLLAAHRIWSKLSTAENDSTARAWFIGANPRLAERSPVLVLREGDVTDVLMAATAFLEGTDN